MLLTCYGLSMSGAFTPGHKHDVALARVGIVVLQKEELINTIFLQS
jgi:hypothetical protein